MFNPRKIITRLLVSFAAVSLIAPLSACGNAGSSSDATSISFYSYFNKNQIGNVLTAFQKKYPKIKIDMQSGQDPQQYVQTLQTRLAGGQAPTIFNLTMDNRTDVMKSGAALDISGSDFFEGINDSNFRLFQQDGKTYGMPVTAWYGGLVYNKDLLGKAGFNQFPRTWDAFIKMGEKLNSQNVTTFL
ncbi:MAG: ABC transporter substrate-binding protein, partial [Bifidobacteriales bacterium]|nr:ABC transporter substrate-binding protein [Bifidobacteriales bacterium]